MLQSAARAHLIKCGDFSSAMSILPIHVNHQQYSLKGRVELYTPYRIPSNFPRFRIDPIRDDEAVAIFERERSKLEGNTCMPALIKKVLRFIPLITHPVYT